MDTPNIHRRQVGASSRTVTPETPAVRGNVLGLFSESRSIEDDSQITTITVGQLKELVKQQVLIASKSQKSTLKKDIKVSDVVKNGIHSIVREFGEKEKTWDFTKGYKEGRNPTHTKDVFIALGNKIGDFDGAMAEKGCRTYFHSLKSQERKRRSNKMQSSLKEQRKRQRKSAARVRRRGVINSATTITPGDKDKLLAVLDNNDYISSEESEEVLDSDSDDESNTRVRFVKKTLPWRSDYLNSWFQSLDRKNERKKQQKRKGGAGLTPRTVSTIQSDREQPTDAPSFAVQEFEEIVD